MSHKEYWHQYALALERIISDKLMPEIARAAGASRAKQMEKDFPDALVMAINNVRISKMAALLK